ncbi:MAG: hypothetical protein D6802_09015 [Ardenticatenia bacterium]|nr:MAG: hypothetical protein D6802_09015 [Ardenticatenia bacterium]
MTTTQPFAGSLHRLAAEETFALREPNAPSPYAVLLHADTGNDLWVLDLEKVWRAYARHGRHVDFAVIDPQKGWVVFVELRRTLVNEEQFFDKVNQACETIHALCVHQPYGEQHHAEARSLQTWQTALAHHALGVCIVPAMRLKSRADQRAVCQAPDGRRISVVVAGHLRRRPLGWSTVLARFGVSV